jgi:hypothetical protein
MLAEVRSAAGGGIPTRPGVSRAASGPYPVPNRPWPKLRVLRDDMAYLSSCGDPQHDAMACIADTFGPHGPLPC